MEHLTGHAVIRLYRCNKCGAQAMVPGDPSEPEVQAAPPPPPPPPPVPEKKGFFARIFGG